MSRERLETTNPAAFAKREGLFVALRVASDAAQRALPHIARILMPDVAPVAAGLSAVVDEVVPALSAVPTAPATSVAPMAPTTSVAPLAPAPSVVTLAKEPLHAARKAAELALSCDGAALATLGSWYAYAAALDPDQTPYDLSFVRAAVSVVGSALGAWLAVRRSKWAVATLVASEVASLALSALQMHRHGTYVTTTWRPSSWRDVAFNRIMPVAHAALAVAAPVAAMTCGPSAFDALRVLVPAEWRALWPGLRKLGLYYMVFSLLGHWGEMLFCTGIKYGLIRGEYDRDNHMLWDQWLFPFPAEGVATVLISLFLYPAKIASHQRHASAVQKGLLHASAALPMAIADTFFLNQIVCTSIDYLTGMVANQNFELWDYRDMPLNFQGQICLQNSLVYTVIATLGVWQLFPCMERGLARVSDTVLDGVFVGLGSFFVFLELLYHVLPPRGGETEAGEAEAAVVAEVEAEDEAAE